jgi:hypothetical protein
MEFGGVKLTARLDVEKRRAAVGLELSREVPEDVRKLFVRYRDREKLDDEEMDKLMDYAASVEDLLALTEAFGYRRSDYMRLAKAMSRRGVTKRGKEPEEALVDTKIMRQKEFVRNLAEDMWSIGSETIMRWYSRASEVGYWDEAVKRVNMAEFVRDAIEFYLNEGVRIRELQQDNVALSAAVELLSMKLNELLDRISEAVMVTSMVEQLYRDVPNLPLILAPIKSSLGLS